MLFSSVLIAIIMIEIGLRIKGDHQSYSESAGKFFYYSPYHLSKDGNNTWLHLRSPNIIKQEDRGEYLYEIKTNEQGLRDLNHQIEKEPNEFRIAAIGGSFTEGAGVTSLDSSWVKVLERLLQADTPVETTITVMNAGVASSDPFYGLMLLKKRLLKYTPNLVLLEIDASDVNDGIVRGGVERFQEDGTVVYKSPPWFEPLFGMSYLARYIILDGFGRDWLLLTPDQRVQAETEAVDKLFKCITDFQDLCDENQIKFCVIIHPMIEEVQSGTTILANLIEKVEQLHSITLINMLNHFLNDIQKDDIYMYYWPLDRHHTAAGYQKFADELRVQLDKNQLLTKPRDVETSQPTEQIQHID